MNIMKKTKLFLLLLILISLAISENGLATTYYVSPSGTGTGTFSSPLSFSAGIGKSLVAGDSLIFRGGSYSFSSSQSFSKSGTSVKYVNYIAYPTETPIFDFRTQVYGSNSRGLNLSGNYMHVKGITVQGAGDNGIYISGSNNFVELCTARWNCDSGFQLKTGSNNYILNCDSYENFDYETAGGNADGFADKQYTNTGTNTYKGCRSWRNSDDGWDSYEKVGNTVYDSCWCYSMAPAQYDMTNHIRYATDKTYIDGFANHLIPNGGNGNGFKMGGNYTTNNATAHHCIAVNNLVKGFDQNNNDGIMTVSNCTSYNNGNNYGYSNSSYGTLIIKNCVSLSSKGSNSFSCKTVTQSNNTWNSCFSCSSADFSGLDYSQMLNPRQADGSLPEINLLHLVSTSGLIDKGLNLGYSFSGTAPDLGAFEYIQTTALEQISENNSTVKIRYSSANQNIIITGNVSQIDLFDLNGRNVFSFRSTNNEDVIITTGGLNKGIYLIRTFDQNGQFSSKKLLIN